MTAIPTTRIHGKWLDKGYFVLWSEPYMRSQELIRKLFAYHSPSYYGTFIQTEDYGLREAIILPADWAVDYWTELPVNVHASFEWDENVRIYARIAVMIQQVLREGWLMPDYHKWKSGHIGWRLAIPDQAQASPVEQYGLEPDEHWLAEKWLNFVVQHATTRDESGSALTFPSIERYKQAYRMQLQMARSEWIDEDEWLQSLGWTQEPAPFRLSLQLSEPSEAGRSWRLSIRVHDRTEGDRFVICSVNGEWMSGQCPPEWRPILVDRIFRETRKYLRVVEELAAPEDPEHMIDTLNDDQAWLFLMEWSPRLIQAGIPVLLPSWWERARRSRPLLKTRVKAPTTGNGEGLLGLHQLLQFDWQVSIGNLDLTEDEYRRLLADEHRLSYIRGQWIVVDPMLLRSIQKKLRKLQRAGGMPLYEVLEYELLHNEQLKASRTESDFEDGQEVLMAMELEQGVERIIRQIQRMHMPPLVPIPSELQGVLRGYQHEGLSWLAMLRKLGFGGCLADDMGLGKTVQWIAYLLHVQETERSDQPTLLICPTSVLGNWQKEFERFAPGMRIYLHHGSQRLKGESFAEAAKASDVVLTSYSLAHLDYEDISRIEWDALCLDEAQNIKNAYTKQAQAIQHMQAKHRVALTGTPLENRLSELWSIMNFVNPGYLGSLSSFERHSRLIERKQDEGGIRRLQALVRPFLLRRVKTDPAISLDLPAKEELKCYVSLTSEQSLLYEQQLDHLFRRIDRLAAMERRGTVLSTIMKLKQLCDHPAMLDKDFNRSVDQLLEQSNKLMRLTEMVEEVREAGERCIIFTQYIDMGKLLQNVLRSRLRETVLFMHGGIPKKERDRMIAEFQLAEQEEPFGVFILSLKTGGTGLNLTAANHVFHYDRWWNPAVENQASDRVYRIGQDKNVFVHKFISIGTLEEKIDQMLERKMGLSRKIVGSGEQWIGELSDEELRELLELR